MADNVDYNEDNTTGANTTYVMGIISCGTSKSEFTREDISSAKLLEAAKFNDNIKVYSKPQSAQQTK